MEGIPTIRLDIEGMKISILHAISERTDEIKRTVEDELNKLDIEGLIRNTVRTTTPTLIRKAIEDTIRNQVEWQFHQAIKEPITFAIKQAVDKLFSNKR